MLNIDARAHCTPSPQDGVDWALQQTLLNPATRQVDVMLLFVVLPDGCKDEYQEIKQLCDGLIGVASQCMLEKHFVEPAFGGGGRGGGPPRRYPNDQYLANIALKIRSSTSEAPVTCVRTAHLRRRAHLQCPC